MLPDVTPTILSRFTPGTMEVAVERVTADLYYLWQHLGAERWWRQEFRTASTLSGGAAPGSGDCHILDGSAICAPVLTYSLQNGAIVRTGAGWFGGAGLSNAGAYNSQYDRTATSGQFVTVTFPADTVRVGIRAPMQSNGGLSKVTIGGSATAATLLPTAQDLVDAGTFANTILVANGGTLNPTDRVIDHYSANNIYDQRTMLAEGLTAAAHVVVITNTGYKRSASSDTRTYFAAAEYGLSTTTKTTASTSMVPLRVILGTPTGSTTAANSESLRVLGVVPTGGTTATLIGGLHGYELQDSLAFTVDGATVTLSNGQTSTGTSLVITRATHLRHPDTGSTNWATSLTTFTLNVDGLRVTDALTFAVTTTVSTAYAAMLPTMQENFDRGQIDTESSVFTFTAHDGAFYGQTEGQVLSMWGEDDFVAVCMYVPDPTVTVDGWARSSYAGAVSDITVQDNSVNVLAKGHVVRIASGASTDTGTAGEVWTSDTYRKAAWFPAGAETAMTAVQTAAASSSIIAGTASTPTMAGTQSAPEAA